MGLNKNQNSGNFNGEVGDMSNYATKSDLETKVTKETNKSLVDNTLIDKLEDLENYDDSLVREEINSINSQLAHKVSNFQGSENVGKILVVDENGYLILDDMPEGTSYPVVGTVDENNVITLSSDKLADGLYTLRYSDGVEYKLIGTVLVGERIVTSITASKGKTTYEIGETLTTNDIVVTAYFNDLTSEVITGYTIDGSSVKMNVEGNYTIIITYENCTTSIPVIVMDMSVTGNLFVSPTCTIGKRISSSGQEKDQANTFLTDFRKLYV